MSFQPTPWSLEAPSPSDLSDHDVPLLSTHLQGKSIALMVCGGIAAMKAPSIARALRKRGAQVTAFTSVEALRYVTEEALSWSCDRSVVTRLTSRAEHLGDGARFDAYLIAPATYNTINKCASGVADSLITTTFASALGLLERGETSILFAPTMHGSMHNTVLIESMRRLEGWGVTLIPPRDAYGKDNLPTEASLTLAVSRTISRSPLRGRGILVTGGPTPVPIDDVRRLTNKFTGRLSIELAHDLAYCGAHVKLLLGRGSVSPPEGLTEMTEWIPSFDEYRSRCHQLSQEVECAGAVFTAAVADYRPSQSRYGKIPSGRRDLTIHLEPTEKVIDEIRALAPHLPMITFKYQEGIDHETLMSIAASRVERFGAVFANRGEERGIGGAQVGWWCERGRSPQRIESKPMIAQTLRTYLERALAESE
jgi:phosphopantothenoylcysteine decarboxylase / phosphopantothenate---cysteine ligase